MLAEARTETDGLRQQLAKRDTDLARLRGQRDDMNAELLERRAKEGDKVKHAEQLEALAKARQVRSIHLLQRVAEDSAGSHYLSFIRGQAPQGEARSRGRSGWLSRFFEGRWRDRRGLYQGSRKQA